MTRAWAGLLHVASTLLAGLAFAPVFGTIHFVASVCVVGLCVVAADVAALVARRLEPLRAPLALFSGLVALVELYLWPTTTRGLPTVTTVKTLGTAITSGWVDVLHTTWPVGADPELMLFVPLLVLLAATMAVEILRRTCAPLLALLPSLGVLALAQAYRPLQESGAAYVALGIGVLALMNILLADLSESDRGPRRLSWYPLAAASLVLLSAYLGATGAVATDPLHRNPVTLQDRFPPVASPEWTVNPLDEIGERLADPDRVAFRNRTTAPVDRWTQVVLNAFDGTDWTTTGGLRRLGARLPGDTALSTPVRRYDATIIDALSSPWLPTHNRTLSISGARALIDDNASVWSAPDRDGPVTYHLTWTAPLVTSSTPRSAVLALDVRGWGGNGAAPPVFVNLARKAVGNQPPSLRAALDLERYFREHYLVTTGAQMPVGHSYLQLRHFLTETGQGTSEQFAAGYVVLARTLGIPTRLAVGFQQPAHPDADGFYTVHNRDVLAWPEIAVQGLGWVPLDPMGTGSAKPAPDTVAAALDQVREDVLPPVESRPSDPGTKAVALRLARKPAPRLWLDLAAAALALPVSGWLAGVPIAKRVRRARRRRTTGASGVVGAWCEVRDLFRDRGLPVIPAQTTRDTADEVTRFFGARLGTQTRRLGGYVDFAVWSGMPVAEEIVTDAWQMVAEARGDAQFSRLPGRLRAALRVTTLLNRD